VREETQTLNGLLGILAFLSSDDRSGEKALSISEKLETKQKEREGLGFYWSCASALEEERCSYATKDRCQNSNKHCHLACFS
jgi:hypothetical protein